MDDPESKTQCKTLPRNVLLLYRILLKLNKGQYASEIARNLSMTRQRARYWIQKALRLGYIQKELRTNEIFYQLTPEGRQFLSNVKQSSLPMKTSGNVRLHNLVMKWPILVDNPGVKWEREVPLNNWVAKYARLTFPIGITLRHTSKSMEASFHQFVTGRRPFLGELMNRALKGSLLVFGWLKERGITIDLVGGEIIRSHIANESPEFERAVSPHVTSSIRLGRKASGIFPSIEDAKAWIDRSLGQLDVETNDVPYEEKLLKMPEIIDALDRKLIPAIEDLAKNLRLHLAVLKKMERNQDTMNQVLQGIVAKGTLHKKKPGKKKPTTKPKEPRIKGPGPWIRIRSMG